MYISLVITSCFESNVVFMIICKGILIVLEALEHKFNVTCSFDFFLPLAIVSKLPPRVTSGKIKAGFIAVENGLE